MKRWSFVPFFLFFFILAFSQTRERKTYAPDRLLVQLKPEWAPLAEHLVQAQSFGLEAVDRLNEEFALERICPIGKGANTLAYVLIFQSEQNIPDLVRAYKATGLFACVEPDYIGRGGGQGAFLPLFPDDAFFSRQWGLYNDGSFSLASAVVDADIDMELAWEIEQGSSSVIVAVLDSGVKQDHPEFSGRIWTNAGELADGLDNDGNGYVDDLHGWDFAYGDNDPSDDLGHGTNVAGIIGAQGNNQEGYAGVDWNCKLLVCRILDSNNFGYYSWWADAIYYAVEQGAKVINMSVGGTDFSTVLKNAVDYAHAQGVVVVASMMNNNNDVTAYPAGYANAIAVGATDPDDRRSAPFFWDASSGSNYGSHIDVVAPGNYIYGLHPQEDDNYNWYWGGTSQATPLVSGLSALLLAQDPGRSPDEIRSIIRYTAEDQVGDPLEDAPGFDIYHGYGRINAYEALLQLSTSTSEQRILQKDRFEVYPSPALDRVFVAVSGGGVGRVEVVDWRGRLVREFSFWASAEVLNLDVSGLGPGVYVLRFWDDSRQFLACRKLSVGGW